jgi:hypothetical protein
MWIGEPIEPWTRNKQPAPDPNFRLQVLDKLKVIQDRGYVGEGHVESLIWFFAVAKGLSDIRMVYDGTRSGLNAVLWAPWFPLPTDIGECFHNWMLVERVWKWCGIDLTSTLGSSERVWRRWNRCAMGLCPSPYVSVRGVLWLKEESHEKRTEQSNVFRWEKVELNLPERLS